MPTEREFHDIKIDCMFLHIDFAILCDRRTVIGRTFSLQKPTQSNQVPVSRKCTLARGRMILLALNAAKSQERSDDGRRRSFRIGRSSAMRYSMLSTILQAEPIQDCTWRRNRYMMMHCTASSVPRHRQQVLQFDSVLAFLVLTSQIRVSKLPAWPDCRVQNAFL